MYFSIPMLSLLLATPTPAQRPVVHLSYASYRGVTNESTGVTRWLGMRYAAAPVGELRFAGPRDPSATKGIQDASQHAPYCISVTAKPPLPKKTSEDCLHLDVFAPSNATNTSALPVFFFIQGGGFASDSNANFNGRGLVEASGHSIVVVTFNYRVGPYGFISGREIDSPNNGIKDQRKALEWVQRYIAAFGGDPDHVVIGGDSAGAASVTFHLTAYGGRDDHLFHAAAAESPSFATVLTVDESQYLYDDLVNKTSCTSAPNTLSCLRKLSTAKLQSHVSTFPYPGQSRPPIYSWNPVIDNDLIRDYTYRSFNTNTFVPVPTIFGADTNDGTIFTPNTTNSLDESNVFMKRQFPYLTQPQLDVLNNLYPNPNITFPGTGAYWRQVSNVYGEMRYMCPALFLSKVFAARGVPSYNYRYNVQDAKQIQSGLGVPHTVELNAIFGPDNVGAASAFVPKSYLPGGSNHDIVPVIQAFWTSFVRTFDPNTYRSAGAAAWEDWNVTRPERFLFDSPVHDSRMESLGHGLKTRCEYLWSIAIDVRQ